MEIRLDDVEVHELGPRTYIDETGEEIQYHAVVFTVVRDGTEYGMSLSLSPGTEPGDPYYVMAIEQGKQAVLAKALEAQ